MDETELFKLLGQSGIAVAALYVLGRLCLKIGERMIAAIDRLIARIDEHTKTDVAAWQEVVRRVDESDQEVRAELRDLRQDVAVLGTRVDTLIDWERVTPAPLPIPSEDSRRRHAIPLERHERVPRSGLPVVERPRRPGNRSDE